MSTSPIGHCEKCGHVFPEEIGELFVTRTGGDLPYAVNVIVETPPGCQGLTSRTLARFAEVSSARAFVALCKAGKNP